MISQIIHLQETSSTNTYAKKYAQNGGEHGTVIWADNQTAGRGRLGKDWQSNAAKGLYCSIVYTPTCTREEYSKITLVAGLAVAEVLEDILGKTVQLKWPNDIYVTGKKCGGILCEAVLGSTKDAIIIGIGINVLHKTTDFHKEIAERATSMHLLGSPLSIESLMDKVSTRVVELVDSFCKGEWQNLLQRWKQRDFLIGKESEWLLSDGRVQYGRAEGIDDNGLLHIVAKDGVRHQVLSGDVQLSRRYYQKEKV